VTVVSLAVAGCVAVALWPRSFPWRASEALPRPIRPRRVSRPRPDRAPTVDLPACAELLSVALSAGCGMHEALVAVGDTDGPGSALHDSASELRRGVPLLDVIDRISSRHGAGWQGLATVLSLGATAGTPSADALRRLAGAERMRTRRRTEQRVRRLPVLLLLPLTTLVLPAFVLVTFVPLAIAGSAALDLP